MLSPRNATLGPAGAGTVTGAGAGSCAEGVLQAIVDKTSSALARKASMRFDELIMLCTSLVFTWRAGDSGVSMLEGTAC